MVNNIVHFIKLLVIFKILGLSRSENEVYKRNPAPDGHRYLDITTHTIQPQKPLLFYSHENQEQPLFRCGVCPTYFQKICGFDFSTNSTFIFDNHCVMDLYNCIHGSEFINQNYENCLYFGNFGYVHGFKYEDYDYEEDHLIIKNSKKNPDFV